MRKTTLIFGVLLGLSFSFGLYLSPKVWGEEAPASVSARVLETTGLSIAADGSYQDLSRLSRGQSFAFENLYLSLYISVKNEPEQRALEHLSESLGYTTKELNDILSGSLKVIEKRFRREANVTQEDVLNEFTRVQDAYDNELRLQNTSHRLGYEALAKNLFYDNDLGNSGGIDLLADLSLLNQIIFNAPLRYLDRGTQDAAVVLSSESVLDEPLILASETDVDFARLCQEDPLLREALEAFAQTPAGETLNEASLPRQGTQPIGVTEDTSPIPGSALAILSETEDAPSPEIEDFDTLIASFTATKGDWTRSLPCTDIFCIKVNLVTAGDEKEAAENGTIPSYAPSDNCVACHVHFINAKLSQTMEKPLAPNKISMNFFEDATCKDAGKKVNLGLQFNTIAKPIVLHPGDQIEDAPQEKIETLKQDLQALGSLPSVNEDYTSSRGGLACERLLQFRAATGLSEEIVDAIEGCNEATSDINREIEDAYAAFLFEVDAANDPLFHEQVSGELGRLLLFLKSFNAGLLATYGVEDAPLPALVNKPYCE